MADWMTRKEAAAYLRISTWQLDHLRLPRGTLGARPRYARADLDEHLERSKTTPGERKKGTPRVPFRSRRDVLTTQQRLDRMR